MLWQASYMLAFASLFLGAAGQHQVSGCSCLGGSSEGYCGYHIGVFSDDRRPWCRTHNNCGEKGAFGSWDYCDERSVTRRQAKDGQWYTSREFKDYYGSSWKSLWQSAPKEKRQANDGNWYTAREFRDYYVNSEGEKGWVQKWIAAQQGGVNLKSSAYDQELVEKRRAPDSKLYNKKEFDQYFGAEAQKEWDAAKDEVERKYVNDKDLGNALSINEFYIASKDNQLRDPLDKVWAGLKPEKRPAQDGKWYTFDEFASYFGKDGFSKWKKAKISGCACLGEIAGSQGACGYHFNWEYGKWDAPWCRCSHDCDTKQQDPEGIWMVCNTANVERRMADDGELYNAKQFRDYFGAGPGGKAEWDRHSDEVERRMADDQFAYTINQFRSWFLSTHGGDWSTAWSKAEPEKRKAQDGSWYTFAEFVQYYGKADGLWHWRKSTKAWHGQSTKAKHEL